MPPAIKPSARTERAEASVGEYAAALEPHEMPLIGDAEEFEHRIVE